MLSGEALTNNHELSQDIIEYYRYHGLSQDINHNLKHNFNNVRHFLALDDETCYFPCHLCIFHKKVVGNAKITWKILGSFCLLACLEEESMAIGIINGACYSHRPGSCLEQVNYTSKSYGRIWTACLEEVHV